MWAGPAPLYWTVAPMIEAPPALGPESNRRLRGQPELRGARAVGVGDQKAECYDFCSS